MALGDPSRRTSVMVRMVPFSANAAVSLPHSSVVWSPHWVVRAAGKWQFATPLEDARLAGWLPGMRQSPHVAC